MHPDQPRSLLAVGAPSVVGHVSSESLGPSLPGFSSGNRREVGEQGLLQEVKSALPGFYLVVDQERCVVSVATSVDLELADELVSEENWPQVARAEPAEWHLARDRKQTKVEVLKEVVSFRVWPALSVSRVT